jgi:hypothetical protein
MPVVQGHVYVDDASGTRTCTCGLPRSNRRHISASPAAAPTAQGFLPRVGMNHPQTSYDAASRVAPRQGTIRASILHAIGVRTHGATDDELESLLGKSHQSVSAARNALMNDGLIHPLADGQGTVTTRSTRGGTEATVWVLTANGRAADRWGAA